MFTVTPKAFTLKKIEASKESIWDVAYGEGIVAAIDETGNLITFAYNGMEIVKDLVKHSSNPSTLSVSQLPATSVLIAYSLIVVADVTGEIRFYSLSSRILLARLAAAARSINALCFHPSQPLLLVASEDTFVSAWDVSGLSAVAKTAGGTDGAGEGAIKKVMMLSVTPGLLTGVAFAGDDNKKIAVTCYDSRYLYVMNAP